jgi:chromosome transmission fidelity protein 1
MILNKATRDSLEIDLHGSLVIFDEAHNLIDTINEQQSCGIESTMISRVTLALGHYMDKFERRLLPANLVLCHQLQQIISRLDLFLANTADSVLNVNELLSQCQIDHINMLKIVDYIGGSKLSTKLTSYYPSPEHGDPNLLNTVSTFLERLVAADVDGRLLLSSKTLKYVSLNPALVMEDICRDAHTVILAGGTMKPVAIKWLINHIID